MFILMGANFGMDFIRGILFSSIDHALYWLVSLAFNAFINMSTLEIMGSLIEPIARRLYIAISIYMVFKIAISLLMGIADPEGFTDKKSGLGPQLPKKIIISLLLLIILPYAMNAFLYGKVRTSKGEVGVQQALVGIVPRIVLGRSIEDANMEKYGKQLSAMVWSSFLKYDSACKDNPNYGQPDSDENSYSNMIDIEGDDNPLDSIQKMVVEKCSDNKIYKYDVTWLMPFITAVIMLVCIISYTFDIAVRAIKLFILQVIAPIPIISYIDTKPGKAGVFDNWLKAFIQTYLDLYLKLVILYLVVLILSNLGQVFPAGTGLFIRLFFIIGLILSMATLPKFIYGIFGIKDDGNGFGLISSIAKTAAIGTATAGAVGAFRNARRAQAEADVEKGKATKDENGKIHYKKKTDALKNILGSGASAVTTGIGAAYAGVNAKNNKVGATVSSLKNTNQRIRERKRNGGSALGALGAEFQVITRGSTDYDKMKEEFDKTEQEIKDEELELKQQQDLASHAKKSFSRADSKSNDNDYTTGEVIYVDSLTGENVSVKGNAQDFESKMVPAQNGVGVYKRYSNKNEYKNSAGKRITKVVYDNLSEADKKDYHRFTISQSEYDKLSDLEKANYDSGTYFQYGGKDVEVAQAGSISSSLKTANAKDFYGRAYSYLDINLDVNGENKDLVIENGYKADDTVYYDIVESFKGLHTSYSTKLDGHPLVVGYEADSKYQEYVKGGGDQSFKDWYDVSYVGSEDAEYEVYHDNGGTLSQEEWIEYRSNLNDALAYYNAASGENKSIESVDSDFAARLMAYYNLRDYGTTKGTYGKFDKSNTKRSDAINKRKRDLNKEKNKNETERAKSNDSWYHANRKQ